MPFLPEEEFSQQPASRFLTTDPMEEEISFADELEAVFHENHISAASIRQEKDPMPGLNPDERVDYFAGNVDVLDYTRRRAPHLMADHDFAMKVAEGAQSFRQADWWIRQGEQELERQNIEGDMPIWKLLGYGTAVGMTNPTEFLGGFLVRRGGQLANRIRQDMMATTISSTTTEITLQEQQNFRSIEEIGSVVVGSVAVQGALSNVFGRMGAMTNYEPVPQSVLKADALENQNAQLRLALVDLDDEIAVHQAAGDTEMVKAKEDMKKETYEKIVENENRIENLVARPVAEGEPLATHTDDPDLEADLKAIDDDVRLSEEERYTKRQERIARDDEIMSKFAVKMGNFGFIHWFIPKVRIMLNDNPIMRRFGTTAFTHGFETNGSVNGRAHISLEKFITRANDRNQMWWEQSNKEAFESYKSDMKSRGLGNKEIMDEHHFQYAVQDAMANGDVHEIAQVANLAKKQRVLIESVINRGKRIGLFNDVDFKPLGDKSWHPRGLSKEWAKRHTRQEFIENLMPGMRNRAKLALEEIEEAAAKTRGLDEIDQELTVLTKQHATLRHGKKGASTKKIKELKRERAERASLEKDMEQRRRVADDAEGTVYHEKQLSKIYDDLLAGDDDGIVNGFAVGVRSDGTLDVTKGRKMDIATQDIPYEMRVDDPGLMFLRQLQRIERNVIIGEHPRFGDPTFGNILAELDADAETRAGFAKTEKERQKIRDKLVKDKDEVTKAAKRFHGVQIYETPDVLKDVAFAVKAWNNLRSLGRVMFSAAPELMMPMTNVGVRGMLRQAIDQVISRKEMQALKAEAKADWAIGWESAAAQRVSELGDEQFRNSAMRKLRDVQDFTMDKVYLLGMWTRTARSATGVMLQSHVGRKMLKGRLSSRDIGDLARMGIDRSMIKQIKKEVRNHHKKLKAGSVDMGMSRWDNQQLANDVAAAIRAETELIIVKPGLGDRPFAADYWAGGLAFQYKSFMSSAHANIWLPGIQRMSRGDLRMAPTWVMITLLTGWSQSMRQELLPEEKRVEYDSDTVLRNAMSMVAWGGYMMHFAGMVSAFTGGQVDPFRLLSGETEQLTKYQASRTIVGDIFGPTVSLGKDVYSTMWMMAKVGRGESPTAGEIDAAIRLTPYLNSAWGLPLKTVGVPEEVAVPATGLRNWAVENFVEE